MTQWEIFLFPFPEEQPHPVVIVSPDDRCINPDLKYVNGLICTTVRLTRPAKLNEVLLDEADGLDWTTAVRCDFLHALPKASFLGRRGRVSAARQLQIMQRVVRCLRFQA
ncbi:MAG: type II toxin-antitoxin system PemK/MazF family toxin [Verrucomicrobiales bacterium]|nr:type II toxin-antitoxin system PemK/MazF family toxin [Verrucomicrobiales bacterium]